jgi:hypothetical protein
MSGAVSTRGFEHKVSLPRGSPGTQGRTLCDEARFQTLGLQQHSLFFRPGVHCANWDHACVGDRAPPGR